MLYSVMTSGHSLEINGSVRIHRKGHHFFRHCSIAAMLIEMLDKLGQIAEFSCTVLVGDALLERVDALPKDYPGAASWYLFRNF